MSPVRESDITTSPSITIQLAEGWRWIPVISNVSSSVSHKISIVTLAAEPARYGARPDLAVRIVDSTVWLSLAGWETEVHRLDGPLAACWLQLTGGPECGGHFESSDTSPADRDLLEVLYQHGLIEPIG